ncbi:MAG: hypothetical protein AMXMBFR33_04010 [Candidatus Xenobia bacterium]
MLAMNLTPSPALRLAMSRPVAAQNPAEWLKPVDTPPATEGKKLVARESEGDKTIIWERDDQGVVTTPDSNLAAGGTPMQKVGRWLSNKLVPENYKVACSPDYPATRAWQLVRDYAGSMAGTAAVGCVMGSVTGATTALLALGWGAVNFANMNNLKDRVGQVTSFLATPLAIRAERNPRPWMMAGDVCQHVCTAMDAAVAVAPPLLYFPILTVSTTLRSIAGAVSGAASANIGPRQAIKGNLGEVSVKNANQGNAATMAGALTTPLVVGGLTSYFGATGAQVTAALAGDLTALASVGHAVALAGLVTVGIGAALGLFANYMMLKNLDYNPVNEPALRAIVNHMEENQGQICKPDPSVLQAMGTLVGCEKLVVGDRIKPILEDPEFETLRELYKDRPYILRYTEAQPYIVMKTDERFAQSQTPTVTTTTLPHNTDYLNRMGQVQAAIQAIHGERLVASPEYQEKLASGGHREADRWLLEESLKKTPRNVEPFLLKLQEAGWSVDLLRLRGKDRPTVFEEK